jgi:small subunit ribosomal protein S18
MKNTKGLRLLIPQSGNSQLTPTTIDYKNIILLRQYISAEGKIFPRRITRLTAKEQRWVARAIKQARVMGLLPFVNKRA